LLLLEIRRTEREWMSEILSLVRKACEVAADKVPLPGTREELENCLMEYLRALPADRIPFDRYGRIVINIDVLNKWAPPGVQFRVWPKALIPSAPACCVGGDKELTLTVPATMFLKAEVSSVAGAFNSVLVKTQDLIVAAFEPTMRTALLDEAFAVEKAGVITLRLAGLPQTICGQSLRSWHLLFFRAWLHQQGLRRPPSRVYCNDIITCGTATIRFVLPKDQWPANFGALTATGSPGIRGRTSELSIPFLSRIGLWFGAH
jgi:hypothetical protein